MIFRRLRPRTRAAGLAALVAFVALLGAPAGAVAAESGGLEDGWWSRLQGPQDGEPQGNPVRTLLPASPAPPNVPANAIAVSRTGGQPDKVAAVGGLVPSVPEGSRLLSLVLRLQEAPASGANVNADTANVVACPATRAWGPAKNAAWRDRPAADCGLSQTEGQRTADGVWTFDLTALVNRWMDPASPLPQHGVVLMLAEADGSAAVTQVAWLDAESGKMTALWVMSAPPSPAAAASEPPSSRPAATAPLPTVAPTGGSRAATHPNRPVETALSAPPLPALPTVAPSDGPGDLTPPSPEPEAAAPANPTAGAPATAPRIARSRTASVQFWDRIPGLTVVLLPLVLALALLVGLALGPGGRPLPVRPRHGGFSRALDRRDDAASITRGSPS